MVGPLLLIALIVASSPALAFSSRQAEAIRLTTIAGEAGKYCAEIVPAGLALGDELIAVGIQPNDFDLPEYERIRNAAKAEIATQPIASLCGTLWNMLGPNGSHGHQLVRLRRPSDAPFVPR
jgi:hypothetical protein